MQMMENMVILPDAACKDAHPLDTVQRIKSILGEHGIETEEFWEASDVPHCYSLRINIAGTSIGANGKGVNQEYALASGYGELIERLQLGLIWRNKLQIEGGASTCEAQSQTIAAQLLSERNPGWYAAFAQRFQQSTGIAMTAQNILKQYTDSDGNVQATPYYCVTSHTWEYLPTAFCKAVYATSGGAAGNTMEEAMVQALSEIVERHHKLRVIHEDIVAPEIPEEVLQSCTIAYDIIRFLRGNGYRVIVKDCSLGTKFPVVCVCIIDTNTGKYHTHFGAYPNFEVALQRTLTESFQGRNIQNITKHEDFFCKNELSDLRHLMVELVNGTNEKPPQFFFRRSEEAYRPTTGFSGKTNGERLRECIAFFREQGYDVLVRDSSTLGFPTCQIIIPGYSEVLPQRISDQFNDSRYSAFASRALQNPVSAKQEDLFGLMMHIAQSSKLKLSGMESFTTESGIPAKLASGEETYLMSAALAHVSYSFGRTKDVISYLTKAIRANTSADLEYLICLKRYLTLQQNKYAPQDIRATLEYFHKPETVAALYACLDGKKNPLDAVVLRCDLQCAPTCRLYTRCKKKYADRLVQCISQKAKLLDQAPLEALLQQI